MQKILILVSSPLEQKPNAQRYYEHALAGQQVTVLDLMSFFVSWDGEEVIMKQVGTGVSPLDFDVVFIAGYQRIKPEPAFLMADFLENAGKPFVGRNTLELYPASKIAEMAKLVRAGVPYPKTLYVAENRLLPEIYDLATTTFGSDKPVVVKGINASRGESNYIVKNLDDFEKIQLSDDDAYMMQEYIPNSSDYRLLFLGSELQVIIKRTRTSVTTHLNNISQGAQASMVPIADFPQEAVDVALAAAKALHRADHAGVDLIVDDETGRYYVLEVNKTPHISVGTPEAIEQKMHALFTVLGSMAKG